MLCVLCSTDRKIGMWQCENIAGVSGGLEGLSAALFTRVLGWSKLELDILRRFFTAFFGTRIDLRKMLTSRSVAKVKAEHKNTKIHSYYE